MSKDFYQANIQFKANIQNIKIKPKNKWTAGKQRLELIMDYKSKQNSKKRKLKWLTNTF